MTYLQFLETYGVSYDSIAKFAEGWSKLDSHERLSQLARLSTSIAVNHDGNLCGCFTHPEPVYYRGVACELHVSFVEGHRIGCESLGVALTDGLGNEVYCEYFSYRGELTREAIVAYALRMFSFSTQE